MSGLTPDFGTGQQSGSATFANPTAPNYAVSTVANGVANALPQGMWQGNPIRNFLGVPAYAASGSATSPTQSVLGTQNYSPANASYGPPPSNGGNNGGGGNAPGPGQNGYINPNTLSSQSGPYTDPFTGQVYATRSAYDAQNQALNTQYDQAAANLNAQLPYLSQQRDSALSGLDTSWQTAQNQANSAKTDAQNNTNDQINQAGDVAHQTQNQNRNILRALGIGGGTYAAELLSKPLNTYDQQRGQLGQALTQRMGQLDDYLNTVSQQHAQAVTDLQNNYANLVGKIQSDLRFNDRQRNDALQAANAALQTNLANIQSSAQQYALQVQQMKMQLAQQAGVVTNWTQPTADTAAIKNTGLSNQTLAFNSGNQTGNNQALLSMIPQQQKQQQILSGLGATG